MLLKSPKACLAVSLVMALTAAIAIRSEAQTPTLTILYNFSSASSTGTNTDGAGPNSIIQASDGNFYGVAGGGFAGNGTKGGANGSGTFFKLTPSGAFTTLYNFSVTNSSGTNSDGSSPIGLIQASDGNFYGVCSGGGTYGAGTLFKLTPSGAFTLLHAFGATSSTKNKNSSGSTDGATPLAGMIQASDSNLYGTTWTGGAYGNGTIFKLTLSGAYTLFHSFTNVVQGKLVATDGINPRAPMIQASDGNLYGTCQYGGVNGKGTIYKITLSGSFATFYSFSALSTSGTNTDGAFPHVLIQASDGNLYGTAWGGGANSGASGGGTFYKITLSGNFTTLYNFPTDANANSTLPLALVQASDGNLYGTTLGGGANGDGTIFQITLGGAFTLLHSFNGTDGTGPDSLFQAGNGTLYGTAQGGGANGTSAIFSLIGG